MPAKNRIKHYIQNGYYYIYNTGVDKRNVFMDEEDFLYFIKLLRGYLSPPEVLNNEYLNNKFKSEKPYRMRRRLDMNLNLECQLIAYCLLSNRFELVIKQTSLDGITKFMRRLNTTYVTYFNKKHHRSGSLFQGVYRAVLLSDSPTEISDLITSIHNSPVSTHKIGLISTRTGSINDYPYSSCHYYINGNSPDWLTIYRSDLVR